MEKELKHNIQGLLVQRRTDRSVPVELIVSAILAKLAESYLLLGRRDSGDFEKGKIEGLRESLLILRDVTDSLYQPDDDDKD